MESNTISKSKSKINVKLIAITAMCAALVTVTTAFIKIPSMFGYSHAGDSMIYLAASILPGPYGIIASSIGGALADLISGYPQWAIPTAIIIAARHSWTARLRLLASSAQSSRSRFNPPQCAGHQGAHRPSRSGARRPVGLVAGLLHRCQLCSRI